MNENIFQKNVRRALDRSASGINQATLVKLRQARHNAMERFDAHAGEPAFAWAGWTGRIAGARSNLFYWLAAILLVVSMVNGVAYWHHARDNDDVEADIAILTDEMPIQVYLD